MIEFKPAIASVTRGYEGLLPLAPSSVEIDGMGWMERWVIGREASDRVVISMESPEMRYEG
jgi:hypothetical protein